MRRGTTGTPAAALLVIVLGSACGSSATSPPAGGDAGTAAASANASGSAGSGASAAVPTAASTATNSSHFTVSGTVRGAAVQGQTPTLPMCEDIMAGAIVTWTGTYSPGGRLAGELDLPTGSGTLVFGAGGSVSASLVVGADQADRLTATSGTMTVAGDHQSGSIDAQFTNGADSVHLTGSFVCP